MARNTKLTPERKEIIIKALKVGVPVKYAAQSAGVCESSFYVWMEKGREAKSGIYMEFMEEVKKAESDSIAHAMGVVRAAMPKQWQAAAWYLERKDPEHFAKREFQDVTQRNTIKLDKSADELAKDEGAINDLNSILSRLGTGEVKPAGAGKADRKV